MQEQYVTKSAEETKAVAAEFAMHLNGGEVIALIGDLGAGKTTFTQGLVAALGSSARVKSPTFTVMNEYPITGHATIRRVVHLDCYRFTDEAEIAALELDDYRRADTMILIEWPEKIPAYQKTATHAVLFSHQPDGSREIIFKDL